MFTEYVIVREAKNVEWKPCNSLWPVWMLKKGGGVEQKEGE